MKFLYDSTFFSDFSAATPSHPRDAKTAFNYELAGHVARLISSQLTNNGGLDKAREFTQRTCHGHRDSPTTIFIPPPPYLTQQNTVHIPVNNFYR